MSTNIPLIDLKAEYKNIQLEIDQAIANVIDKTAFINGEDNEAFELEFAEFCGATYGIGCASGSVALDLVLEAMDICSGDEVLCPAHTFTATAEAIVHVGATPVFVDVDESTYNLDPEEVIKKISDKTKAIIAVHLYGLPAEMDALRTIANEHDLYLIEDAAQAHGAEYKGKKVGSLGDAACFSFFPAKNLGCYGDGGMVVTDDEDLAHKIRKLVDHGRMSKYEHESIGYGVRLDNLQAAILRVKLKYLVEWNSKRNKFAKKYSSHLRSKYIVPKIPQGLQSSFYVYTLRHKNRDHIVENLKKEGIGAGIYYPLPLHLQPAYKYLGYRKGDLPITEKVCDEIFSVPMNPFLKKSQIDHVVTSLLS